MKNYTTIFKSFSSCLILSENVINFINRLSNFKLLTFFVLLYSFGINGKIHHLIYNTDLENPQSTYVNTLMNILNQMPGLIIENNKLVLPTTEPYFITSGDGNTLIIIDTLGKINSLKNQKALLLLNKERLIYRTSKNQEKFIEYSKLNPLNRIIVLNRNSVINFFLQMKKNFYWFDFKIIIPILITSIAWSLCFKASLFALLSFIYYKKFFKIFFKIFLIMFGINSLCECVYFIVPSLFYVPKIFFPIINFFLIIIVWTNRKQFLK